VPEANSLGKQTNAKTAFTRAVDELKTAYGNVRNAFKFRFDFMSA